MTYLALFAQVLEWLDHLLLGKGVMEIVAQVWPIAGGIGLHLTIRHHQKRRALYRRSSREHKAGKRYE